MTVPCKSGLYFLIRLKDLATWLALAKGIRQDIMWATYKQNLEDTSIVSGSPVVLFLYHSKFRKNVYHGAEVQTENTEDVPFTCMWILWCWEGLGAGWTGRPGVLRFMGSQRVGPDWATELNWVDLQCCVSFSYPTKWSSYTYSCIYSFSNSFLM